MKSAKDVLDEQAAHARKRKREDDEDVSDVEGIETENPISNITKKGKQTKKLKREDKEGRTGDKKHKQNEKPSMEQPGKDEAALAREKAQKKKEKRVLKKAKEAAKAAKSHAKRERKARELALAEDSKDAAGVSDVIDDDDEDEFVGDDHIDAMSMQDIMEDVPNHLSSTATPSTNLSPAFDASISNSSLSSISSVLPPNTEDHFLKDGEFPPSHESEPSKARPEELKARLAQRIEALRAARNPSGDTPKNRQELMEQRRAKEEQRRMHKKELRRQAKEEEQRQRSETLARGSPLLSGSPLPSPRSPLTPSSEPNSFSFGRVNLADGQHATANLNTILQPNPKTKGPSDPRTALIASQNKQSRLNNLDEAKRADIAEKDTWLNARKRAHGERIRDDTSLLKKTLKRKEKQKKRSEKEWDERIEGVKKGQDFQQKKREANLQKRRDEKGGKGKKSQGPKKGKPKARPGFEGSFRAKAPSSVAGGGGGGGQRRR